MDRNAVETEIQEKGLNKPRVTPAHVDGLIKQDNYHVFEGSLTTVCEITLTNGFTVIGTSACAHPENFDEEIGKNIAFQKAKEQIWQLEGYLLKEKLYCQENQ